MKKENQAFIILTILIIIVLVTGIFIKINRNNNSKELVYYYYSYYKEEPQNDIIDGEKYQVIETYDEYQQFSESIKKVEFQETISTYKESFFSDMNLVIVNAYEANACSNSSYDVKIELKDKKLTYEAEYSLGGVCAGGIGYLTIIETLKDIEEYEVCLDNQYHNDIEEEKKPVLYLYPEEDMNVTVSFKDSSNLTTTYPKYNENWNVFVQKDGTINLNNKKYYALYWETKTTNKVDFSTGFYVTKENAISFLEEKLSIIGLNYKEQNEFIMYWLPILENNEQSLVYFELTKEKQMNNELIIKPTPDSLLRVTMHVKKVNEYVELPEQKLSSFERKGFVAVEWGGVEY